MSDKVPDVAIVGGVGEVLGRALARRFGREGLAVALVARNAERLERVAHELRADGCRAESFPANLSSETEVVALFDAVESRVGAIDAALYVAATRVEGAIVDTSAADFETAWRLSCFSGFLFGREAGRRMLGRGRGSILFSGSAGSLHGRARFGAFDAAKGALRHLAQSMARELGPRGIHVATVLIQGAIESERIRRNYPERMAKLGPESTLAPDDIAETYWRIHRQPRSAWSHEVDLRPWTENS